MKKIFLVLIILFTITSIYGQNFKRYQAKSGIIKYKVEGISKGTEILYFDNFGSDEAKETKIKTSVMGFTQENNQRTVMNDATIFVADYNTKTYTKMPNPFFELTQQGSQNIIDAEKFGEEIMKNVGGKMVGEETVLGKPCKIWEIAKIGTKTWTHKFIPLKIEIDMMGIKTYYIATSIELDVTVPAEKFKLPDGFTEKKNPGLNEMLKNMENFQNNEEED
ncbi:MAG: hypothetical protein ACEPO8_14565 [Rhodothermaceae bacterium]